MTEYADHVILNARIWTSNPTSPQATAMAIGGGRITAVGQDDEVRPFIGPHTSIRNLEGGFIMPGLIDVHNHHQDAGDVALNRIRFADTAAVQDILRLVKEWATSHPNDEWIVGGAWGGGLFEDLSKPEVLKALNEASKGKKVLLNDDSMHNRWANTAALSFAGIDSSTPDPEGGRILRDSAGNPTGILVEAAGALLESARAANEQHDFERAAASSAHSIEELHSYGVTAFQDAAAKVRTLGGLSHLERQGGLNAWVVSSLLINDPIFGSRPVGLDLFALRHQYAGARHRPTFAKIFLDGVPTARSSAFLEPYLPATDHNPDYRGAVTMPVEELVGWLRTCQEEDLGLKVHCTGDAAVRTVLDAVEIVRGEGSHILVQVAHATYISEEDIPRFARLGVFVDCSPALWFPGVISHACHSVLPADRADRIHPHRDLIDAGAVIAGGSDWPVAPVPNPWIGIAGLISRADPFGEYPGTLWPEQAITVEESLRAYTMGPAEAMGIDDITGSLAPGKSADFILLDRDPFTTPASELADTKVHETWFAGAPVYQSQLAAVEVP